MTQAAFFFFVLGPPWTGLRLVASDSSGSGSAGSLSTHKESSGLLQSLTRALAPQPITSGAKHPHIIEGFRVCEMACCFRGKRLHADKETEHATTDAENAGADEDDVEVNAEDLARLSMLHLKQAFESLPSKGGQTYKSGTIMKVKYLDEDHCNYSTSGFDASERMAYRVLVPVPARGRNVGYALDVGYRWSKEDRGNSDKEEFQAHVKLLPDGPSLNVKEGGSRDSLLAIADEMPELDSSAKTKLKQIIQECTKR